MIKPLRKNVLVDCGKAINQLESDLIVTPDKYRRLDNQVKIVAVGSKCELFTEKHVGKTVIVEIFNNEETRYSPRVSEKYGLNHSWHMMVPERFIQLLIEK